MQKIFQSKKRVVSINILCCFSRMEPAVILLLFLFDDDRNWFVHQQRWWDRQNNSRTRCSFFDCRYSSCNFGLYDFWSTGILINFCELQELWQSSFSYIQRTLPIFFILWDHFSDVSHSFFVNIWKCQWSIRKKITETTK